VSHKCTFNGKLEMIFSSWPLSMTPYGLGTSAHGKCMYRPIALLNSLYWNT